MQTPPNMPWPTQPPAGQAAWPAPAPAQPNLGAAGVAPPGAVAAPGPPWAVLVVGSIVLLVVLVVAAVVVFSSGEGTESLEANAPSKSSASTGEPEPRTTEAETIPTEPPESTQSTEPVSGGISDLPPGLMCEDLRRLGFSYTDAVGYWYAEGAPDRMDIDVDGEPCETMYPPSDVREYWGPEG